MLTFKVEKDTQLITDEIEFSQLSMGRHESLRDW